MRDSIVEKLRGVLSGAVEDECKVTYILVESRKLLDKYPVDPVPFALKLYCHWALHIDLSHPGTTKPFLERVDTFVGSVLAGSNDLRDENRMLRDFLFMDTFRNQFIQFLKGYNLPNEICDQESRWNEFLKHYAGIIEDGSLSCTSADNFEFIREVVFAKGRDRAEESYIPFDLSWRIGILDGRTMTVDVSALPHPNGQMISNVISLT